jgi:hypothetical protein
MLAFLVVGCTTKSNPAKYCETGTCIDPAFPFCDVTGAVGGEAGTCIAVTCTPGAFTECRGDNEVRCNATGNNMEVVQCERGCDGAADGCRLCNPGETACTNGKVATCDASGAVVSTTSCQLGCFETEPRCREINPSNALGKYLDMVPNAPNLDYEQLRFDTRTGEVTDQIANVTVDVPNFLVQAPNQGAPIRVFVANTVKLTRANADALFDSFEITGPALAIVAHGEITIVGILEAHASAGAVTLPACSGGAGLIKTTCNYSSSASGGGGFGTNGAKGGDIVNFSLLGGTAGIVSGNEKLVPLRGGCASGGVNDTVGNKFAGSGGGGAVQLVSRTRIFVDGIVSVVGQGGSGDRYQPDGFMLTGGGSGGALLLEAPVVELGPNAQLLAQGGNGADACGVSGVDCTMAGAGARVGVAATPGVDTSCDAATGKPMATGGGGGGLGRIRINTASGSYTKANSAVEAAVTTAGTIETR